MSFSSSRHFLPQRFLLVLTSFLQKPGLAFADLLPEEKIQQAFDEENVTFAEEDDDWERRVNRQRFQRVDEQHVG
jgi:hypothetical protein